MTPSQEQLRAEQSDLIAKREELVARIDAINADMRRGLDKDFEEQAAQLENTEVLEGIAQAASEELAQVDTRLEQIKQALAKL